MEVPVHHYMTDQTCETIWRNYEINENIFILKKFYSMKIAAK